MSASASKKLGRKLALSLTLLGLTAGIVVFSGVTRREKSKVNLAKWTKTQATPTVDAILPKHGIGFQELVLPGEVAAWYTAPIHARVSGYVKMWFKDIGAKVKAGDVLAEIDTPELDQQLEQAKGELSKAEANATLAQLTAKRWQTLSQSNAVSQQATDEKVGDFSARLADVTAAKANVARLQASDGFKQLTAPFDGIVTERKVDVGALVDSSKANASGLFEVADVHEMRIYVEVPQAYASELHAGMTAKLILSQYPGRHFNAVLATTSEAITKQSRTLLVELRRDNQDGLLLPGSFVEVHFELPADQNVLTLPSSALIFRGNHPKVAVVGRDQKIVMKDIKAGRDLGSEIEVVSGLDPTDEVVRNPSDSIGDGDLVRVANKEHLVSNVR
jgi:RND family efflux transporter MFP subunit